MTIEPRGFRIATERVHLPPMTFDETFHWNGVGTMSRDGQPMLSSKHTLPSLQAACSLTQASCQTQEQSSTGRHDRPSLTTTDTGLWAREAEGMTFSVNPRLLLASTRELTTAVTGELLWAQQGGHAQPISLYVHPVLIVHVAYESLQVDRVEIVPHFQTCDPLLCHITPVLKTEIEAEGVAGRLYAELLINALAVHLLRRLRTCRPSVEERTGSLSKHKLRRTTEYIEAHLEEALSLTDIAAIAQTSPDYFARLFRHATGRTPHQCIIRCRIERAKRLLLETALPIIDISRQVGFTDQSYFTAVFRNHVSTTPKAYRTESQR
jgi:AraC-like DNA-binding protein